MKRLLSAALTAVILAFAASPALADGWTVRDASGVPQNFCTKLVGVMQHPCHVLEVMVGGNPAQVTGDGTGAGVDVNVRSSTLPSGAATATNQATEITNLSNIATNTTGAATSAAVQETHAAAGADAAKAVAVQGVTNGKPVSVNVQTSALPTGAATAANQSSEITSLGQIHTDLTGGGLTVGASALPTGAATAASQATANSSLATIASNTAGLATAANQAGVDARPATQSISAADVGTTSTAGQGGVSIISGTPTANSAATFAVTGQAGGALTVKGTFSLTAAIEASYDGGGTYVAAGGLLRGSNVLTNQITGAGTWTIDLNGVTNLRVRATAYTSGAATIALTATPAGGVAKVLNTLQSASAQNPSNSNKVSCTINTSTLICGPFTPTSPDFHVSHAPSGFTATCQLERKTDGTNWAIETVPAGGSTTQMANQSFSASSQATSEDYSERQAAVPYQEHCTSVGAGSDLVTFSQ